MDTESIGPDSELLAKYRLVCENALRRLTADLKPDDVAGRDVAYARIRESNETFIRNNREKFGANSASAFRSVVEEVIAHDSHNGKIAAPASGADKKPVFGDENKASIFENPARPAANLRNLSYDGSRRSSLIGGLIGFALASFVGFAVWVIGAPPADEVTRQELFNAKFAKALPQIEAAVQYLDRVEQEIVAVAGKKFVSLDKVLPELAKEMPAAMPARTGMLVRATAKGYKIVFRSRLCAAVEFARPELLDRVREPANTAGLGCEYFGVWNKAGARF
jgi:hypothetical protein